MPLLQWKLSVYLIEAASLDNLLGMIRKIQLLQYRTLQPFIFGPLSPPKFPSPNRRRANRQIRLQPVPRNHETFHFQRLKCNLRATASALTEPSPLHFSSSREQKGSILTNPLC